MCTSALLDETDVKVVYDQQGNKREVLLSYEKYQEMLEFIERYAYFYSREVQERLQRANKDIAAGRYMEAETGNIEAAVEWLAASSCKKATLTFSIQNGG